MSDAPNLPDELIAAARRVIDANRAAGLRFVVAESCTGGLVAAALTAVPGASDVFDGGYVTYSNEAKMSLLGVSSELLETFGAVSIAVAWAMAHGAQKRSNADIAVAITGIAGPGGGSARKPVGTVVFGVAKRGQDSNDITADKHELGDLGRAGVQRQAALVALELLMPDGAAAGTP